MLLLLASCSKPDYSQNTDNSDDANENKGRVVFSITDDAADMQAVSKVQITVDKIEVHSNADS
ncbi:MAG TPA: hypothetical protein VJG30_01955 [Candidatus Nanoarchaeia archaeon]|nr:hypothetical protein [Candidatus Nanoarchaeia archaeon]